MARKLYSVKERKRGGKRWRTSHIHGRGKCVPKTVANKFSRRMKKYHGKDFVYRVTKC